MPEAIEVLRLQLRQLQQARIRQKARMSAALSCQAAGTEQDPGSIFRSPRHELPASRNNPE